MLRIAKNAQNPAMRRYPAVLWLLIYIGSLLILNGSHPTWKGWQLALGILLPVIACGVALYLAAGPWPGRPKVRGTYWALTGTFGFYLVTALVALVALGIAEAIAVLLAGLIPMTAVAICLAHVRQKTEATPDGALVDDAAEDHADAVPGLGVDDVRPLGDTPEAHAEVIPQDIPKGHPGRPAVEQQAEVLGGTTPGHRDGGAAAIDGERAARRAPVVDQEEAHKGARFHR
jgi:hypothetical protein